MAYERYRGHDRGAKASTVDLISEVLGVMADMTLAYLYGEAGVDASIGMLCV